MREKINCAVGVLGLVIAALTYFGVDAADLLGAGESLAWTLPLIYLFAGGLIGYSLHSLLCRRWRFVSAAEVKGAPTKDEVRESFAGAPFEIKVFLKAILIHKAVYRETSDYVWKRRSQSLEPFIVISNIRNGVSRCTLRDAARRQFEDMPELLRDVTTDDIDKYAFGGMEGDKPSWFSTDKLHWWFYTDD